MSYTKTLRLNVQNAEDIIEKLEKYPESFDNVVFFSHHTHSVKNLDYHRKTAQELAPVIRKLQSMRIKAGFNILGTVGFFPENNDSTLSHLPKYRNVAGKVNTGKLCPVNAENRSYIKELYGIYAAVHPDIIYIDDDIDGLGCTCDRCLKSFGEMFVNGKGISFEEFRNLIENENTDTRKRIRESWISHNVLVRSELCELIENAVHSIDKNIIIGFMTYTSGVASFGCELWADKLSGADNCEVSWRPGGGVYTDDSMLNVCDKANRISLQIRYIPQTVKRIEAEIENFPYQSLNKSPDFTAFESFVYMAAGCTGTAYNVMSKEEKIGEEHEPFFKMAEESGSFAKLISEAFGRSPLRGVGFVWNPETPAFPENQEWTFRESIPVANDIHRIGIPFASENASVYLLNGDVAAQLSDAELEKCLLSGVYMDCEALDICNKRGFHALTGFAVEAAYDADAMEVELDHPLNMPGNHKRNPRQAFKYTKTAYTIKKTDPNAEYLAMQTDLEGNSRGYSAGIFENESGGRVYVSGVTPFDWCFSLPRTVHIKNVMRRLSGNSLPAYVVSFHRACIWARNEAVFVANTAMADAEQVELMIKTNNKSLRAIITKGSKIVEERTVFAEEYGEYMKFTIPCIPILGTVLLLP